MADDAPTDRHVHDGRWASTTMKRVLDYEAITSVWNESFYAQNCG
jgi:hypothetical protein